MYNSCLDEPLKSSWQIPQSPAAWTERTDVSAPSSDEHIPLHRAYVNESPRVHTLEQSRPLWPSEVLGGTPAGRFDATAMNRDGDSTQDFNERR